MVHVHHDFLSYTKRASSLPAKLGSGIWHTFSQPGITLANQSTSNSSAKAVYPFAFCVPATTIVEPSADIEQKESVKIK